MALRTEWLWEQWAEDITLTLAVLCWPSWEHCVGVISRSRCKKDIYTNSFASTSLHSLKSESRRSDIRLWLTLPFSHCLTFLSFFSRPCPILLPASILLLIFIFAAKLCLWGVGKWAEQSMWGFEDHLEPGAGSLCGAASWTYKETGGGRDRERESNARAKRCEQKARGAWVFLNWVCSTLVDCAFGCSQAELLARRSHPQSSRPLFVIWIPSPPHSAPTTLKIHWGFWGKVGALILKECDSVCVKSSRRQCLLNKPRWVLRGVKLQPRR